MLEEKDGIKLQEGMRTLWPIWAAMFASLGVYLIVAHFIGQEIKFDLIPKSTYELLRYALMGVGAVILYLTQYVRRFMLRGGSGVKASNSTPLDQGSNTNPILRKYMTAVIISVAMSESVGIFGLVLFFLSGDFKTLYLFVACSAIAVYIYRPKIEELEGLFQATELYSS